MLNRIRYFKFLIVGAIGVVINYYIYYPFRDIISFNIYGLYVDLAWFFGILVSASVNYSLNELWTFSDGK